jgi:hypothetical protein
MALIRLYSRDDVPASNGLCSFRHTSPAWSSPSPTINRADVTVRAFATGLFDQV